MASALAARCPRVIRVGPHHTQYQGYTRTHACRSALERSWNGPLLSTDSESLESGPGPQRLGARFCRAARNLSRPGPTRTGELGGRVVAGGRTSQCQLPQWHPPGPGARGGSVLGALRGLARAGDSPVCAAPSRASFWQGPVQAPFWGTMRSCHEMAVLVEMQPP